MTPPRLSQGSAESCCILAPTRGDSRAWVSHGALALNIARLLLGSPCGVEPLLRREAFRHGGVTGIDAFPEDVYIDHLGFGEAFFRLHIHPF